MVVCAQLSRAFLMHLRLTRLFKAGGWACLSEIGKGLCSGGSQYKPAHQGSGLRRRVGNAKIKTVFN